MKIDIIRHAESMGNVDLSVYMQMPDYKVPLTNKGRLDAVAKGAEMAVSGKKYDLVYCSPMIRATETLDFILKGYENAGSLFTLYQNLKTDVFWEPLLREQSWGDITDDEDRAIKDQRRREKGKLEYQFPGGESGWQVIDRSMAVLRDLASSDYTSVLLVTHGFTMRALRWCIQGGELEDFEKATNPANLELWSFNL